MGAPMKRFPHRSVPSAGKHLAPHLYVQYFYTEVRFILCQCDNFGNDPRTRKYVKPVLRMISPLRNTHHGLEGRIVPHSVHATPRADPFRAFVQKVSLPPGVCHQPTNRGLARRAHTCRARSPPSPPHPPVPPSVDGLVSRAAASTVTLVSLRATRVCVRRPRSPRDAARVLRLPPVGSVVIGLVPLFGAAT